MKKFFQLVILAVLCMLCIIGCRHKAETLQENGIWEERRMVLLQKDLNSDQEEVNLSISVLRDMTEEEMLQVLDYYEKDIFTDTGASEKVNFGGEEVEIREREVTMCYAIFYKGNTDEVLKEFKYADGKNIPLTEEDETYFNSMKMDDQIASQSEED